MQRRQFLSLLATGAALSATPKFIFDLGARVQQRDYEFMCETFDMGTMFGVALSTYDLGQRYRTAAIYDTSPDFLPLGPNWQTTYAGEIAMMKHALIRKANETMGFW